jgi:phosphate transport system permease protein
MTKDNSNVQHRSAVTNTIRRGLEKRNRREKIFRSFGFTAVVFGFLLVFFLLFDITSKALPAFSQHWVLIDVDYSEKNLRYSEGDALENLSYRSALRKSWQAMFPEVKKRRDKRNLSGLLSSNAEFVIRAHLLANPSHLGKTQSIWVRVDDDVDVYLKEVLELGEPLIRIDAKEGQWIKKLVNENRIEKRFNVEFFTYSDSREPELAGVRGALTGTLLTMLVTLVLSFPLGVAAAVYLEEFAPKNRWTDMIEVNINNLAAVPSIIFGLLGLAVIINIFGLPRSAPLVGGIVLTLMTLPTIIISSRASIKAVPPSIREAAIGLGASKIQTTFGHVLPMAMPGILTGTIIGMAQALGETAPLLMIGMVAFIVDVPGSITDAATVMPVQIFLWADSPERGFLAKTSAAILVLLGFLFLMNATAAYLRRRFETK